MMKRTICILLLALLIFSCKQKKIWDNAKIENSLSSYKNYLKQYPDGKFVDSAKFYFDELKWLQAADSTSKDTNEVNLIDTYSYYGIKSVIPYGREKLLTIFNPIISDYINKIELSYKLENELKEMPVLVASYYEANKSALTSCFYYGSGDHIGYNMLGKMIYFSPEQIKDGEKVRLYFVAMKDFNSVGERCKAVSNVVTIYLK